MPAFKWMSQERPLNIRIGCRKGSVLDVKIQINENKGPARAWLIRSFSHHQAFKPQIRSLRLRFFFSSFFPFFFKRSNIYIFICGDFISSPSLLGQSIEFFTVRHNDQARFDKSADCDLCFNDLLTLTWLACRIMEFDIKNRIPPDFNPDFYFRFFTNICVLRITASSSRVELFINKIVSREERWSLCTLVSLPCYKQLLLVLFFFLFFLDRLEEKNTEFSRLDCGLCKFVFLCYFCFFFIFMNKERNIRGWGFVSLFQYCNE